MSSFKQDCLKSRSCKFSLRSHFACTRIFYRVSAVPKGYGCLRNESIASTIPPVGDGLEAKTCSVDTSDKSAYSCTLLSWLNKNRKTRDILSVPRLMSYTVLFLSYALVTSVSHDGATGQLLLNNSTILKLLRKLG